MTNRNHRLSSALGLEQKTRRTDQAVAFRRRSLTQTTETPAFMRGSFRFQALRAS